MSDTLILVDSSDREVGYEQKEKCHKNPAPLHRAFSIFVFNGKGELLIQKRNGKKKTWGGFWSNTCCSHPRKGEKVMDAAMRRLHEELGFSTHLKHVFKFEYDAVFDRTWGEHELDHVFVGEYDGEVSPSKEEVENCKWIDADELRKDMKEHPEKYTPWFKICFERVLKEK